MMLIRDGNGDPFYHQTTGVGSAVDPLVVDHVGNGNLENVPLYQFLDEVGDGSGNVMMNVDGSVTPVVFKIVPPAGKIYKIARFILSIRDNATMAAAGWGGIAAPGLTNGCLFEAEWNTTAVDLFHGAVKSHFDLASLSYDVSHNPYGVGDEFIVFRFTFTKAGQYLTLNGDTGDEFRMTVQDNLTAIADQHVCVQGKIIDVPA